jgi:hypothetical protein
MKIQDEFIRSPRWALVFWKQSPGAGEEVEMVVLLDPFEADIAIRELRLSTAKGASLHRFAPRNRRDQKELIISGLTSWSLSNAVVSQEILESKLSFAVMALSVFGSSTCYQKNIPDGHSIEKLCRFLGLVPPPSLAKAGITSEDWRALINGNFMESDGFVGESNQSIIQLNLPVSSACLELIQAVRSGNQWKKSPIEAVLALVQLRNMSSWYDNSDLNAVVRK